MATLVPAGEWAFLPTELEHPLNRQSVLFEGDARSTHRPRNDDPRLAELYPAWTKRQFNVSKSLVSGGRRDRDNPVVAGGNLF